MNKALLLQLESLKQKDLSTRKILIEEGRLYGAYEEEMRVVHIENARALNEIIDNEGWPGISKVGLEGSRAAWLVAQHSICTPDLQKKFLKCLADAVKNGDAPAKQVALLTDRIRFNEGNPQVYGTVYDWDENGELTCDVENPEQVDELRKKVGLQPYRQAIDNERMAIEKEGGGPPEDLKAYKQAAAAWAKSVGWR